MTIIVISYGVLFESSKADLSGEGKKVVAKLAETFKKHPCYHMRIEGHTNKMPFGNELKQRYHSNWEPSAGRAATVAKYRFIR